MTNFGHLKNLEVTADRTADFSLHMIEGAPTLTMVAALDTNKGYFNASLKGSRKNIRSFRNGAMSAEMLEDTRDQDRTLYASHVIKSWSGVKDSTGKDVKFSIENCLQFLQALPNWLFDEIREFAGTPGNFIEDQINPEDVGKNSQTG